MERFVFPMAASWTKALRAGQDAVKDKGSHLQLLVFNVSLYQSVALTLLAGFGVAWARQWELLVMLPLPSLALLGITLYCARRRCFLIARLAYLVVSHFMVGLGIILYGKETNLSLYFLHLALFPFLLFRAREWPWIVIGSLTAFLFFEMLELQLIPTGLHPLDAGATTILRLVSTLGSFTAITLPAGLLLCQSQDYYQRSLERRRHFAHDETFASITRLSAGAADDIIEPLATLHHTLDFLQGCAPDHAPGIIQHRMQKAQAALRRIHGILQKLLVRNQLPRETLCVTVIAQLIMQRCKSYLHHHGIQLQIQLDLTDASLIRCDRQYLIEAVDSLIHNALEAMNGHGKPMVLLTLRSQHEYFQVEVTDTGPGVSEDMVRSLFTPFFTTKAVGMGLGLNLYSARCLARQYGGDLTCGNGPGGRFCLSLPLHRQGSRGTADPGITTRVR